MNTHSYHHIPELHINKFLKDMKMQDNPHYQRQKNIAFVTAVEDMIREPGFVASIERKMQDKIQEKLRKERQKDSLLLQQYRDEKAGRIIFMMPRDARYYSGLSLV